MTEYSLNLKLQKEEYRTEAHLGPIKKCELRIRYNRLNSLSQI